MFFIKKIHEIHNLYLMELHVDGLLGYGIVNLRTSVHKKMTLESQVKIVIYAKIGESYS